MESKTHRKLKAEIAYLNEWVRYALPEIPKYRDVIEYYADKPDHALSAAGTATLANVLTQLGVVEKALKDMSKGLRKLTR